MTKATKSICCDSVKGCDSFINWGFEVCLRAYKEHGELRIDDSPRGPLRASEEHSGVCHVHMQGYIAVI